MLASQSQQAFKAAKGWELPRQPPAGSSDSRESFYEQRSLELRQQQRRQQQPSHGRLPSQPADPTGRRSAEAARRDGAADEDSGRASASSWVTLGRTSRSTAALGRSGILSSSSSRRPVSRDPTVRFASSSSSGGTSPSRQLWSEGSSSAMEGGNSLSSSLSSDAFASRVWSPQVPGRMATVMAAATAAAGLARPRGISGSLDSAASRRKKNPSAVEWLARHPSNGYIRVHAGPAAGGRGGAADQRAAAQAAAAQQSCVSWLVACSAATEAHAVCSGLGLGLPASSLHVQLNGGPVRRLDAFERPLAVQNAYLCKIGHTDPLRVQLEGLSEDLQYLVKFYAGKPSDYGTYGSRGGLSAILAVRFAGVLQRWTKRLCVLSGTKLAVYKDKTKQAVTAVLQMAKGKVEVANSKNHDCCLKLTANPPDRVVYLSFDEEETYSKWHRKLNKATIKSQLSADLSDCNLEFLPEAVFNNDELTILNLRRNSLKHRPIEEDIYTIGWLEDLSRFACLQSLNLADNSLEVFPSSICEIKTLVELNLASNRINDVPPAIAQLANLQALHLHNNWLTSMPSEITSLSRLSVLVLAFNKFRHIPAPVAALLDSRLSACEVLVMAGNEVDSMPADTVMRLRNAAKLDLRMNCLKLPATETIRFGQLERLTHLDVRDNQITDLDLRAVRTLEYINVERNGMRSLWLCGLRLKTVLAASNELQRMVMSPKPEWLETMDVSKNSFEALPSWLPGCLLLTSLRASHNKLTELPDRLLRDGKRLRTMRVDHNKLTTLGGEITSQGSSLEELVAHCNVLQSLPHDLLYRCSRLRVLNVSSNRLSCLPQLNSETDSCRMQELYLSDNHLGNDCFSVISACIRLRILHLAYNEISSIPESGISELGLLQDVNISGNRLQLLPASLCRLPQLRVLRAHSNPIIDLPSFKDSQSLMVLELGHGSMDSYDSQADSFRGLLELQAADPGTITTGIDRVGVGGGSNAMLAAADGTSPRQSSFMNLHSGCEYGFTETAGNRNRLCTASIYELPYRQRDEALFGVVDGGRNEEITSAVKSILPHAISEEFERGELRYEEEPCENLRHALLATHRGLQATGQKLGASAAICWIGRRRDPSGNNAPCGYTLEVANSGDVGAVLCRGESESIVITRSHAVNEDALESWRVFHDDGIITEDGKVDGVSRVTRCLGCSYLYPHVLPDPWVSELALLPQDRFMIIANAALWRHVAYAEAVSIARPATGVPGGSLRAARLLRDLAQSYGCSENISVVVVQFNGTLAAATTATSGLSGSSLHRLVSSSLSSGRYSAAVGPLKTYDDYQNVDELVTRSLQPAPQLYHVKKRPVPEPRISLKKMYDTCKLSSLYTPSDYVDFSEIARQSAVSGARTASFGPSTSSLSDTSGAVDGGGGGGQMPSNGRDCSRPPADGSSPRRDGGSPRSSPSASSSSKTLTGSSTSSSNNSWLSCDAWNGKARSRERRRQENADRQYGSDTRLQYPSDVEFQQSSEYFNRPPMAASSVESCRTDADSSSCLADGEADGSSDTLYDDGPPLTGRSAPRLTPNEGVGSSPRLLREPASVSAADGLAAPRLMRSHLREASFGENGSSTLTAERLSPVVFAGVERSAEGQQQPLGLRSASTFGRAVADRSAAWGVGPRSEADGSGDGVAMLRAMRTFAAKEWAVGDGNGVAADATAVNSSIGHARRHQSSGGSPSTPRYRSAAVGNEPQPPGSPARPVSAAATNPARDRLLWKELASSEV